jgi:putative SOS response-associated peptidase YedK
MQGIHDRMPIIFPINSWDTWLSTSHQGPALSKIKGQTLTARPVSSRVNSVANDDPACLETPPLQSELF